MLSKTKIELQNQLKANINAHQELLKLSKDIDETIQRIEKKLKKGGKILFCGNGGSAAISNHYVCDYLKFLRQHTNLKPKVISLSSNLETITAISNDFNYDQIFKYQAESLFEKNDLSCFFNNQYDLFHLFFKRTLLMCL